MNERGHQPRGGNQQSQANVCNKVQQRFSELKPMKVALSENVRKDSIVDLNRAPADTIVLRDLYRSITGRFPGIHFPQSCICCLDEHQGQQAELIDDIAERIMQLGGVSIAMGADAAEESEIPRPRATASGRLPRSSAWSLPTIALSFARQAARRASERGDDGTNDLLVSNLIRLNEKQAWFVSGTLVPIRAE
jgi:starvation-inducible DNA-binding protein